jgi:hypothetical protein
MNHDVTAPGRELGTKFASLGNMTDKTSDKIIAVVGWPTSRSSMAGNQILMQWQATGYHIAILFEADGRFVKVTHESAHFIAAPTGCLASTLTIMLTVLTAIVLLVSMALR